ncbi:MAG: alpha/beta hydrolase family protein [Deltaproteobacteria bacterium]|nr:alpha/beta hydrolase family protein [Deltaproteobacteria bacterium]MBW2417220.1 alpha/beta hydrolase family protein [Deltaproteobacteria bacterium]
MDGSRVPREVWISLLTGLCWLTLGARAGMWTFVACLPAGLLLSTSGVNRLISPGDERMVQVMALGGAAGALLGLLAIPGLGLASALILIALSVWCFVAAGNVSLRSLPPTAEAPAPIPSVGLAAKVAVDSAILGGMLLSQPLPMRKQGGAESIAAELHAARELFEQRGWLEKPADYHRTPLPLEAPQIRHSSVRHLRHGSVTFEHLAFESEYEPMTDEPGRDRWLSYAANRSAHAWVLRHEGEPRPWLVCVHGYHMGAAVMDLGLFDPAYYHDKLGLNLLLPTLPLHGRRKLGRLSGQGYLVGNVMDTLHAQSQAIWDIRRLISWVRGQGAPPVGIHGVSLGGYTAALLPCLEADLACTIAGIPLTDFTDLFWTHASPADRIRLEDAGVTRDVTAEVFRVVSPLAMEPMLPAERRTIYGGVADLLVRPHQVRNLRRHWGDARMVWYQGSHTSFFRDRDVRGAVDDTLRAAGLVGGA